MENIHLIETNKPSRLHKIGNELGLTNTPNSNFLAKQQNIYITSDEEIKEGDWFITKTNDVLKVQKPERGYEPIGKKIILTTDQSLDGVQAIDDEFLEWFVKNPSCEEVMVGLVPVNEFGSEITVNGYGFNKFIYKITYALAEPEQEECCTSIGQIKRYVDCVGCDRKPKEELNLSSLDLKLDEVLSKETKESLTTWLNEKRSTQETLEDAAVNCWAEGAWDNRDDFTDGFVEGAKWQAEQNKNKYSEEDMREAIVKSALSNIDNMIERCNEIIEEFKNK